MRGEVAIGPSIYGVYVIDGSLCSRVYGILQAIARPVIPLRKSAVRSAALAIPARAINHTPKIRSSLKQKMLISSENVYICRIKQIEIEGLVGM